MAVSSADSEADWAFVKSAKASRTSGFKESIVYGVYWWYTEKGSR